MNNKNQAAMPGFHKFTVIPSIIKINETCYKTVGIICVGRGNIFQLLEHQRKFIKQSFLEILYLCITTKLNQKIYISTDSSIYFFIGCLSKLG